MKKILFLLCIMSYAFCIGTSAQGLLGKKIPRMAQPMEYYLRKGAVTEEGGKVVFRKDIPTNGKKADLMLKALSAWADLRYAPDTENGKWNDADYYKNSPMTSVSVEKEQKTIVCHGDEEQVFISKPLVKDYTRIAYNLCLKIENNCVKMTVDDIVFFYNLSETVTDEYKAEDWITDGESITRKGELNRKSGKFRVRMIDLVDELQKEIENTLVKCEM